MNKLAETLAAAGQCKLALLGIPFDNNSSFLKGAAQAPPVIRQAFHSDASNSWAESGIDMSEPATIFDAGDLEFTSTEAAFSEIEHAISQLLDCRLAPISLGGDHSITYPILKAFRKKYSRLNILHFDAHPDLYDQLQGNRFSHASPFARIMEDGLADRLLQIGIRTMNAHQRTQAEKFGVESHEMKDWCGHLHLDFDEPLYVTIDIDALDPAFAPGVSHHEPGGLSTREVINLIHSINAPVIVGADIVEFNPTRDLVGMTAMVCAKLLKEIAAKML
jgi:arginase